MKNKKVRCYVYIRVSTTMQVDGYSLDAQRDKLRKYAEYNRLLTILLFFEVKLFPQKVFILDVDPKKGQIRDSNKKSLKWLKTTKSAYLKTINSSLAEFMNIELIPEELPIEKKCNVIINYIEGERKNGNR